MSAPELFEESWSDGQCRAVAEDDHEAALLAPGPGDHLGLARVVDE